MYTKEQASLLKQTFWKTFGQYLALQPSAEGQKVNWINYKTGIKHLSFKMQADHKSAAIMIEMSDPDTGIQELMMAQFREIRPILHRYLKEEWEWQPLFFNEQDRVVSRIGTEITGVNILSQAQWPELISFLKPRIVALDAFWAEAQYAFDMFS